MSGRPLFVSTGCLPGIQPLNARVNTYRHHNLSRIELGSGISLDNSLSQLADLDCQFLVHNYFPPSDKSFVLNLASIDTKIRERSINFVHRAIELCVRLKAPFYSVHAGFTSDPVGSSETGFVFPKPVSSDTEKKAMVRFIASLETCIMYAEQVGIGILIENNVCTPDLQGKVLLKTSEEFLMLFHALPSQKLGVLLDTGHLNVAARTFGFQPMKFVNEVSPFIRAFHLHDNDGTADMHRPVAPQSWVLKVLAKPVFSKMPVVIEAKFNNMAELSQHINWLKGTL